MESTNRFIKFMTEGLDLGLGSLPALIELRTMAFALLEL